MRAGIRALRAKARRHDRNAEDAAMSFVNSKPHLYAVAMGAALARAGLSCPTLSQAKVWTASTQANRLAVWSEYINLREYMLTDFQLQRLQTARMEAAKNVRPIN